jgi:shikimate dehydrogenase
VWNRTRERAEGLASDLGATVVDAHPEGRHLEAATYDVLVNTTTVGLRSAARAPDATLDPASDLKALCLDADSLGARHVVVDLVYGSAMTPLAQVARERGAAVVDGIEVLVLQGALSLGLWTGLDPPLDVMRQAARNA